MKIFRPEHFGGVLYDTETLRFNLVTETPEDLELVVINSKPTKRTDILSAPVRAYFELTRKCNLVCKHCFVSSSPKGLYGSNTEDLKKMIDDLVDCAVIDVRFTGGEPTVRDDWFEVLSYAKEKNLQISMNTNGVYDDSDEVISRIASLNLNQVTISLDGNSRSHNYMRGNGNYERTIESIIKMAKAGIKVRTNTVLTKLNYKEIPEIIEAIASYVHEMNFFHMRPVGRGISQNNFSLTFEDHFDSAIKTIDLRSKYPNVSIMHFEQSYRERSVNKSKVAALDDALSHGNTTINIDCFGGVWPNGYNTYQDTKMHLGNLLVEGLHKIWNDSEKLDTIRSWYNSVLNQCKSCNEYCTRCPGLSPEMEIANQSNGVKNNFCISEEPMPILNV